VPPLGELRGDEAGDVLRRDLELVVVHAHPASLT
jgi:hypothetical protein